MSDRHEPPLLGRRTFLLGGASLLLSACAGPGSETASSPGPTTATASGAGPAASSSASRTPGPGASSGSLPARSTWAPDPRDVDPEVKRTAARLVEALGNWDPGAAGTDAARSRVRALGQDPALVGAAGAVVSTADASVLRVIDAQYGGVLATSASVLVVTRVWTRTPDGGVSTGGATYDVRLSAASPTWRVTAIHPSVPGPAVIPSALARDVLASPGIDLPPASAADIASGQVHDAVLTALLTLSRSYRIGVSVVRSGHPLHVFGTDRLSDHPRGRAFDTWMIDDHPVVAAATPSALVTGYMRAAQRAGSYNVGGPYVLSGSAFFSDATHHDHVHAGFAT